MRERGGGEWGHKGAKKLTCRGASALGRPMGRGSKAHTPSGPTGNRNKNAGKAGSPSAPSPGALPLPPAAVPPRPRWDRRDGDVGMVACEAVFKPAVRRAVNEYVGFGVYGARKWGRQQGAGRGDATVCTQHAPAVSAPPGVAPVAPIMASTMLPWRGLGLGRVRPSRSR